MYLVKTVSIKDQAFIKEADSLMFLSKNLYNSALYIERQQFFTKRDQLKAGVNDRKTRWYYSSFDLYKKMSAEQQPDFEALPSGVAQRIVNQAAKSFKAFLELREER